MMKYLIIIIITSILMSGCTPHGMANLAETGMNYSIDFSLIQDFDEYMKTQCPLEGYQVIEEDGIEYCLPFNIIYNGTESEILATE